MNLDKALGRPRGLPVTILAGFLGSGKTTLLNYILSANHGLKIAVIVNEFGEIGIDNQLVIGMDGSDDVIELSNGCICCSVRTDLYDAVRNLLKKQRDVDYLVIETTGLANPQPIAQTFFVPELQEKTYLDSIVTVVDAVNFPRVMRDSEVAEQQVAFADFVLLNKVDDAFAEAVDAVEKHIRGINPFSRIIRTNRCQVDLNLILDVGAFDLDRHFDAREAEAFRAGTDAHDHGDDHNHHHDHDADHDHAHHTHFEQEGYSTASFVFDAPFAAKAFQDFLETLPAAVFRAKGILWFLGEKQRAIFNQVGSSVIVEWGKGWGSDSPNSQIVFIGKDFDKATLYDGLNACTVRPKA
ncbi:GTP-binding protein [Candidatus Poribacteria bacterium]|nr:GTP-binding protein [Candidatus Poribacteria bacterium]